jgi:hypothetical protein
MFACFNVQVPFLQSCAGKDDEGNPMGIPMSPHHNPLSVLTDDAQVAAWRRCVFFFDLA